MSAPKPLPQEVLDKPLPEHYLEFYGDWVCWKLHTKLGKDGYSKIHYYTPTGKVRYAKGHRVFYTKLVGPIPEGLQLDHLCKNKACVHPSHLEPVTAKENLSRSDTAPSTINEKKTHCPKNHPYSGDNLYVDRKGRNCRECAKLKMRRLRAAKRNTTSLDKGEVIL